MEEIIMDYDRQLLDMLQHQIVARGVTNPRILEAMQRVPRHLFVPEDLQSEAYQDHPLCLPEDQATISQPYIVAYMTDALNCQMSDRILEIGTGSGYQAAILSFLCKEVYTVERHFTLSTSAQRTVQTMGINTLHFNVGDGTQGWRENAPFDKIIVTAAARTVPKQLVDQLEDGGSLLVPIGEPRIQTLTRITKKNGIPVSESLIPCVFVPLVSDSSDMNQGDEDGLCTP